MCSLNYHQARNGVWHFGLLPCSNVGKLRCRRLGIDRIVLVGAVTAFCVTSSTRAASDLGFQVILPGDALLGFDLPAHDGGRLDAATVHRVTLSLLGADFARLTVTDQVAVLLAG